MVQNSISRLPSLDGVTQAARRLKDVVTPTPLLKSELLSKQFEADVWLKIETVTPIASFKLRGSFNALITARENNALKRAVTSSTGNHGQAVAYAARVLGAPADVFLPDNPNPTKRDMIAAFGATLHIGGFDIDDAKRRAREFCATVDGTFVDDGESLDVIEGAGTIGLEIGHALPGIDVVFVPMGSGSLVAGTATVMKSLQPGARIVAVQAEGSPAMVESFHARRKIERAVNTIADCLVCREPADVALNALIEYVDDAVLVSDDALLAAIATLASDAHVLAEAGAVAGLAAAWQQRQELKGKRVVLLITGANIPMPQLLRALSGPRLS